MLAGLYIVNEQGTVLINRIYNDKIVQDDIIRTFMMKIIKETDPLPIFCRKDINYIFHKDDDIYVIGVAIEAVNVVTILHFLECIPQLSKIYFGSFDSKTVIENFFTLYEILDEIIDYGIPQITESEMIKQFLTSSPEIKSVTTSAMNSSISWRNSGIKHKRNEIFLDVVEKIELLIDTDGTVIQAGINGCLRMKSNLSGMPELKLGLSTVLTKPKLSEHVQEAQKKAEESLWKDLIADIRFHQCVRLNKFETEKIISFIPPDGEFDLMTYRVHKKNIKELPFTLKTDVSPSSFNPESSKVEFILNLTANYNSKIFADVSLEIPIPKDTSNPIFRPTHGSVTYKPELNKCIWTLKMLEGKKECLLSSLITRSTTSQDLNDIWYKNPVEIKFEVPFYTVSGVTVKYLKIFEASGYHAMPWVRYITQNADYQVRLH